MWVGTAFALIVDVFRLMALGARSHARLTAENLFLRKQLALYVERQAKPRRADDAPRITLVVLAQLIEWRRIRTVVQPDTLVRWHRQGFWLFWRWRSRRRGRPPITRQLQQLIAEMATANRTWGEERIASELQLEIGISLSPRTIRRYMQRPSPFQHGSSRTWTTFVRNHAREVLVCDFFATISDTLRNSRTQFLRSDRMARRLDAAGDRGGPFLRKHLHALSPNGSAASSFGDRAGVFDR